MFLISLTAKTIVNLAFIIIRMQELISEIKSLETIGALSKHEQLIEGLINSINQRHVKSGEILPSVNQMSKELGFSRETVVKGYKTLIDRGIIESKNRRGYYVSNEDTDQQLKVAIIMFAFDTFQETFYQNFRKGLGPNVQLDVFFHHNNIEVFEHTIGRIKGKYGMYVIAPIPSPVAVKVLEQLPLNKLLIVDRFVKLKGDYSYIVQEFEESAYNAFAALAARIKQFDNFVFFFKDATAEPDEILSAFKRFILDYNVNGVILDSYESGSVEKGNVYFTINNLELWEILKDTKSKNFILGKDIGVVSHNDDHVKEIIFDGITTFSIDFAAMGKKAAEYVLNREPTKEVLQNILMRRNSL